MSSATDPSPALQLLTVGQVAATLAMSERSVWRCAAKGLIPAPLRIGSKLVRWRQSDLRRYLDALGRRTTP